jgi:transcription antitermination factor NusG
MQSEQREPVDPRRSWAPGGDVCDECLSYWFAVQVRTGREQSATTHLRTRGYDVFLPCYQTQRRWSDRVKRVECALFAGYVFCRMAPAVTGKILTAPGVIRIVGNRAGPLPVSADEIEAIQRIVETFRTAEPWPFVLAGDRVHLDTGPLQGLEGLVVTVKNRHRLIVSVSLLQRSVAVEIDPAWVSVPSNPRSWRGHLDHLTLS